MTLDDILANTDSMDSSFRKALKLVLQWEVALEADGRTIRWENVVNDHGGATFAGLTKIDDDIEDDPSPLRIASVYHETYWRPFAGIPDPVRQCAFVQGVNQGVRISVRNLQSALNDFGARLVVDGALGDATRNAAMGCPDAKGLATAFLQKSRRRYEAIIAGNAKLEGFREGWMNRLAACQADLIG